MLSVDGLTENLRGRLGIWTAAAVALLLAAYAGALAYSRPRADGEHLRYDRFVDLVETDRVQDARILDRDGLIVGRYRAGDGALREYQVNYFNADTIREGLSNLLVVNNVPTVVDKQFTKSLVGPITVLLPSLIVVVVFVYLVLSWRMGTGPFGATSAGRKVSADKGGITLADVAGQDAAVADLREVVEFLKDPQRFAALGVRVPKGVLLYGPPGCGKTLLARAVAGETGVPFYSISGSDFVELYVGVGASRVRDLFREARANAPAIVFVDELDSIGRARGATGAMHSYAEQEHTLNQILAEMDGFSPSEGIVVLAATNRPDVLDPALLRPGRFDRSIALERPDESARYEILSLHARRINLAPSVDLRSLAGRAHGMTGADLATVVNEAALIASRSPGGTVGMEHLESALTRIAEAPERQRRAAMKQPSIGRRPLGEERVTFADVAGVDDAVEELSEVRDYLTEPERFRRIGARVPRGVLLVGPPGCGKTLLARAVAGEANASFVSVAASEFVEVFVGEGASRVRELFAEARSSAPAIVFIDEIDSIGGRRADATLGSHREVEQTLNQILVEMDGFETTSGVIVMAATNRPDILDPALVRPGRFDRQIVIDPPDRDGRRAILQVHARDKVLGSDVDLDKVASLTSGFSGADLANVLNEAALLGARRGRDQIGMDLIEEGIERAMLGVGSRARRLSDEERQRLAVHEAGHALAAMVLPGADPPHKVTIVSRGRTLGFSWSPDETDRTVNTRSRLLDVIACALAGRVAEEVVLGEGTDGAANDLSVANNIARKMVREFGMGEGVGPVTFPKDGAREGRAQISEQLAQAVDSEVHTLLEQGRRRAREVIETHRDAHDRLTHALLDRETLTSPEIEAIVALDGDIARAPRSPAEPSEPTSH